MKYPESYRNAHRLQQLAYSTAFDPETESKVVGSLIRAWLDLEWFKREMRGMPRLKASDLLANMKRLPRNAQRTTLDAGPIEIVSEPAGSKESLKHSFSETVPTPPPSDAPERG